MIVNRNLHKHMLSGLCDVIDNLEFEPFSLRVTGTAGSGKTQVTMAFCERVPAHCPCIIRSWPRLIPGRSPCLLSGASGPVFMYTTYEKQVIEGLITRFPDLAAPLARIVGRLVDLCEMLKKYYYHPKMLGSWSLKAVSPTIDPELDYAALTGIAEGMAASDGYVEAINPATTPARKAELEEQLLRYCRLDTEAMVKIVHTLANTDQAGTLA